MAARIESEAVLHGEPARAEHAAIPNKHIASRLWEARGFIGGSLAILLAWLGQREIANSSTDHNGLAYYAAAITLLLASLVDPIVPLFRRKAEVSGNQNSDFRIQNSDEGRRTND